MRGDVPWPAKATRSRANSCSGPAWSCKRPAVCAATNSGWPMGVPTATSPCWSGGRAEGWGHALGIAAWRTKLAVPAVPMLCGVWDDLESFPMPQSVASVFSIIHSRDTDSEGLEILLFPPVDWRKYAKTHLGNGTSFRSQGSTSFGRRLSGPLASQGVSGLNLCRWHNLCPRGQRVQAPPPSRPSGSCKGGGLPLSLGHEGGDLNLR